MNHGSTCARLAIALLVVATCAPLADAQTAGKCSGTFDGTWDTGYGILRLSVGSSGQVQAAYIKKSVDWSPEIRSATVQGKVLKGQYTDAFNNAEGVVEFHLADDGRSFSGGWTR